MFTVPELQPRPQQRVTVSAPANPSPSALGCAFRSPVAFLIVVCAPRRFLLTHRNMGATLSRALEGGVGLAMGGTTDAQQGRPKYDPPVYKSVTFEDGHQARPDAAQTVAAAAAAASAAKPAAEAQQGPKPKATPKPATSSRSRKLKSPSAAPKAAKPKTPRKAEAPKKAATPKPKKGALPAKKVGLKRVAKGPRNSQATKGKKGQKSTV